MSKRLGKKPQKKVQRESVFQPEFREDLKYWVETNRKTAVRIFQSTTQIYAKVLDQHLLEEIKKFDNI